MNSLGWSICFIVGVVAWAITDSIKAGALWGGGLALVFLLFIMFAPSKRDRSWRL